MDLCPFSDPQYYIFANNNSYWYICWKRRRYPDAKEFLLRPMLEVPVGIQRSRELQTHLVLQIADITTCQILYESNVIRD